MFDSSKYKDFARIQLKKRYSVPAFVFIFSELIIYVFSIPSLINQKGINVNDFFTSSDFFDWAGFMYAYYTPPVIVSELLSSLVGYVLVLASTHLYLKMSRSPEPITFADFIEGFSSWGRAILCGLMRDIFIFLWSLLFFFPGIIKIYSYSQMFFLADEFPEMSIRKTMKISKKITSGHKFDLFLLDLSFIGWFILVPFTLGFIGFWLIPYYRMTKVNAYHGILKEAVESGKVSMDELREDLRNE